MANEKNEKKDLKKKAKGPGFFARAGKFFREVFGEVKKIAWPSKKDLVSYTLTVIAFIVLMSIVIGVLDFVFGEGMSLLGRI
ncbi:MAG: preprotein translocase subunit SecE [Clostridiales bacterium]|nr:preprotein translocase subunit SecE [Clostridiales bacterium]